MGSEVEGPKDSWYRGFEVSTVRFCCGFVVPAFPSVADGSSNRATWVSALSRGVCWAVFCIRHVLRLWCSSSPLLWCLVLQSSLTSRTLLQPGGEGLGLDRALV